ncbi:hypothetical protein [Epinotia aporema granulovirus]|uniref:Uncharacterized protein n=1 Tax=Epinotia aporema granulovirus TaxID=166056 RepID=K4EQ26_9BBAC|nr:hypothetical protein [Epinotia aporema granulovirus]AER41502.1 hypothetical protein [Epinotia aporema granulovirus]
MSCPRKNCLCKRLYAKLFNKFMAAFEHDLPPPRTNNNSLYPSLSITLHNYDKIDDYCRRVLILHHHK